MTCEVTADASNLIFLLWSKPPKINHTTLILETITQYHLNVKLPYFQLFSFILEMSRLCYKQPKYSTMQCFARANILYIQNLRLAETSETRYECTAWQKNPVFSVFIPPAVMTSYFFQR